MRPPIEFMTENGYTIVRRSETEPWQSDSTEGCHFLVRDPNGHECAVTVAFNTEVILLIQKQKATPISSDSPFWADCAERHLATYLWQADNCPPDGWLVIDSLPPEDLMRAAAWNY